MSRAFRVPASQTPAAAELIRDFAPVGRCATAAAVKFVMIHRFSFPTTIHFGPGARGLVADHLNAQGVRRPLVVTDRGIAPLPLLSDFVAA